MKTVKLLFAITMIAVSAFPSLAQETFSFPARSTDIDSGAYWTVREFGEGAFVIDFNVSKYNDDLNQWIGVSSYATNEQDFTWDVPVYAPANGRIVSCWRNFPDDPAPDVQSPFSGQIFGGGNHVVILTDDNNVVSLNHFKSGTIRADLCTQNSGNTVFPTTMALTANQDWRVASYIDPADRPSIREGEYIGRAGSSGNSSGPHLHMSVAPVTNNSAPETVGNAGPFRFRNVWGHRYEESDLDTPEGWYRHRGAVFQGDAACDEYQANSPDCGFKMIHASPYLRRADASAGGIKKVDPVFLSGNRAVTAVIESDDQLKLISWDIIGINQIIRKFDITEGEVKDVQIAKANSDHVIVAVRTQSDELKMIAYRLDPWGHFIRVADYTAGDITALSMVEYSTRKFVTTVRDNYGNLKLIVWELEFDTGGNASIDRLGQAQAGEVSTLSVAKARNFNGVFTAVRDGDNNLLVIPWKISSDGLTLTRGTEGTAGEISTKISAAALAKGVGVAVRDDEGNLRVMTWESSTAGNITGRRETVVEGAVTEVDLLSTPLSGSNLTAGVRDAEGELRLIGLLSNDNGTNLRRIGSSKAGAASRVAAAGVSRSYPGLDSRDMVLTAMRDSVGDLKLITWDTNLVNP